MNIRLVTLGGFRVYLDGAELSALPGQPLRAALLIHLAAESPVSRATLTTMFWPESDETAARHALRQCLYNLSAELGAGWIRKHVQELRVGEVVQCDAVEFESALRRGCPDTAAALYSGPFLDGVHLIDIKPWENWVDAKRAQLARGFRKSCREWVNARVADGDLPAAIRAARIWCKPDPFDDEAQHRLIEVLVAAGERTDALRQYEVYERLLEPDGLQPLEETRRLVEGVRQASPGPPRDHAAVPSLPSGVGEAARLPAPLAFPGRKGPAARPGRWPRFAAWRGSWLVAAGLAGLMGLVAGLWWVGRERQRGQLLSELAPGVSSLDTTLYAVIPIQHRGAVPEGFTDTELLEDALERWDGIRVAPLFQVREGLAQSAGDPTLRTVQEAAASVGAGRFTVGESTPVRGAVRVRVSLYNTWPRKLLDVRSVRVRPDLSRADSAFNDLADGLLFRGASAGMRSEIGSGTHSAAARRAMATGNDALFRWDLPRADSAFATATREDPQYTLAYLWLAQVGMWQNLPPAAWASPALLAWTGRQRLSEKDRLLAEALHALSSGDAGHACAVWKELTQHDELDFVVWYGYGMCLRSDSLVVRDTAGSPSGWRFRSSVGEAAEAFHRAFLLRPSLYRAFSGGNYDRIRALLHTSRQNLRRGYATPPDTAVFLAYPEWRSGRLTFVPRPVTRFTMGSPPGTLPDSVERAVLEERRLFRELATTWATAFPDSADAIAAVAVALELLNDESALDTLSLARSLARDEATRTRIGATEVWLRLKYSIPQNPAGVRAARLLADSLLRSNPPEGVRDGKPLVALAVLLGRADRAAAYQRTAAVLEELPARNIGRAAAPLMVYAALGGPVDSLRVYENQLASALDRLPAAGQSGARRAWLTRTATVAYPDFTFRSLAEAVTRSEDLLFNAQWDFLHGRSEAARRALEGIRLVREGRSIAPGDLTLDAVLPEAALLVQLGDSSAACEWLDGPLRELYRTPSQSFTDPMRAGGLVRAMVLRARLAWGMGDVVTAHRWALPALELLEDPDPFLRPTRDELRRIVRSSNPG